MCLFTKPIDIIGDVFQALLNRNEHPGKLCAFHAYAETLIPTQEVDSNVVSKTNATHAIVKVDNVISKVQDMIVKKINDAAAHVLDTIVEKVVIPFSMTLFKSTVEGLSKMITILVEGSKPALMVGSSYIDCEDIVLASETDFSLSVAEEHTLVPSASNRELDIISSPVTRGSSISIVVGCLIIGLAFFSGIIRKDEAQFCLAILQLVGISCNVTSFTTASVMKTLGQIIIASVAGFASKENAIDELQLGSKSADSMDSDSDKSVVSSLSAKSNLSFDGDADFDTAAVTLVKQTIPVKSCLVAFLLMALASSPLGVGHTNWSSILIIIASLIVGVACIYCITLASSYEVSASTSKKTSLVLSEKQQQVEADEIQDSAVSFDLMHALQAFVSSGIQHAQRERGNLLIAFLFMALAPLLLLMIVATTLLIASGNSWSVVQVVGVVACLISITSRIGKALKNMAIHSKGHFSQCLGCLSRIEPTTTISNAITDVYEAFVATLATLIIATSISILGVVLATLRPMVQALVIGWCMSHCSKRIFHQLLRLWHFQLSCAVDFFEVTRSSGPLTNVVINLFHWTSLAFAYFEDVPVEAVAIAMLQPLAMFHEISSCFVSSLAANGGFVCTAVIGMMISTMKAAMSLLQIITFTILKPIMAISDTVFQVAQVCTKTSILVWYQVKSALQSLWRVVTFWPSFYWRLFGPSSRGRSMADILLRSNPEHLSRPMRNSWAASDCWVTPTTKYSICTCLANIQKMYFVMCSCIVEWTTALKTAVLCFVGACLCTVKSSTLAWFDLWKNQLVSVYRAAILVLFQVSLVITTIIIKLVVTIKDATVQVVRAIMKGSSSACFQVKNSLQWLWKVVVFWPRFYWRLLGPSSHGRSIIDILLHSNPNDLSRPIRNDTKIDLFITSISDSTDRLSCWFASVIGCLWLQVAAAQAFISAMYSWIVECATTLKDSILRLASECIAVILQLLATVNSIGVNHTSHHLFSTSQRSRYRKKRLYDQRMAKKARLQRHSSVKYKWMTLISALHDALVTFCLKLNDSLTALAGRALIRLHTATIFAMNCIIFATCIFGSASMDIVGLRLASLQVLTVPNGVLAYQAVRPPTNFATCIHCHEHHQHITSSFAWHPVDTMSRSLPFVDSDTCHSTYSCSFHPCSPTYSADELQFG